MTQLSLQGIAEPPALANLRSGFGDWTVWFAAGTGMPQGQGKAALVLGVVWCAVWLLEGREGGCVHCGYKR